MVEEGGGGGSSDGAVPSQAAIRRLTPLVLDDPGAPGESNVQILCQHQRQRQRQRRRRRHRYRHHLPAILEGVLFGSGGSGGGRGGDDRGGRGGGRGRGGGPGRGGGGGGAAEQQQGQGGVGLESVGDVLEDVAAKLSRLAEETWPGLSGLRRIFDIILIGTRNIVGRRCGNVSFCTQINSQHFPLNCCQPPLLVCSECPRLPPI